MINKLVLDSFFSLPTRFGICFSSPFILSSGIVPYEIILWLQGPGPDARIIYIDGAFDLFHAGHVEVYFCSVIVVINH